MSLHAAGRPVGSRRSLRIAGIAGLALYPVFAIVVVLLTWLEWDFLHGIGWTVADSNTVNYPSALARGDLGLIQSVNFIVLGALAVVFGRGLRTQFIRRWSGAVATAGLGAVGLAGLLSAFVTDLPGEAASWHGNLHALGFYLLLLGLAVASVAGGLALRGAPGWNGYWLYSLVNVPLAVVVAVALSAFGQVAFYGLITVLLAWFAVMGLRLRQLA